MSVDAVVSGAADGASSCSVDFDNWSPRDGLRGDDGSPFGRVRRVVVRQHFWECLRRDDVLNSLRPFPCEYSRLPC